MTFSGLRVCIIGAGAAGLCACRHLAADISKCLPTVFEQTETVGGTWVGSFHFKKLFLKQDMSPEHRCTQWGW